MPPNKGNTTIASLIRDIHDKINYPFPIVNYKCDGTGVDTDYDTAGLFRNRFGYSTATRGDYNSNTIKQQLRANRPVILQEDEMQIGGYSIIMKMDTCGFVMVLKVARYVCLMIMETPLERSITYITE